MAFVYLLTLFLAATCAAPGDGRREVRWTRTVLDLEARPVDVEESVLVTETDSETTVLMTSSDAALRQTPFIGAVTLHDFRQNRLALKPNGTRDCFVGEVLKSYEETIKEIEAREKTRHSPPTSDRRRMAMSSRDRLDSTGSDVLDKFCFGRRLIPIKDVDLSDGPCGGWPVLPPILCFWVPVDVLMETREALKLLQIKIF